MAIQPSVPPGYFSTLPAEIVAPFFQECSFSTLFVYRQVSRDFNRYLDGTFIAQLALARNEETSYNFYIKAITTQQYDAHFRVIKSLVRFIYNRGNETFAQQFSIYFRSDQYQPSLYLCELNYNNRLFNSLLDLQYLKLEALEGNQYPLPLHKLTQLTCLETIDLSFAEGGSNSSCTSELTALSQCSSLNMLTIKDFPAPQLSDLKFAAQIKILFLEELENVAQDGLQHLSSLTNLVQLSFKNSQENEHQQFDFSALHKITRLRHLEFINIPISAQSVAPMTFLQDLRVSFPQRDTTPEDRKSFSDLRIDTVEQKWASGSLTRRERHWHNH